LTPPAARRLRIGVGREQRRGVTGTPQVGRLVALGASNLTRGFGVVVATARATWGRDVEILAALGHGRSYGSRSRLLARSLPGILESGLWRELESRPPVATRGLVTDVGNDLLYGFSVEQTLAWVREAVSRLKRYTDDVVLTDLPLTSIRRLSAARYLFFRTLLVPSCRLSLSDVLSRSESLDGGLGELAATDAIRMSRLRPSWYGFDPIHIRAAQRETAWREILGIETAGQYRCSLLEMLRLSLMPPERRRLCGLEQHTPQSGVTLPLGGRVWLY